MSEKNLRYLCLKCGKEHHSDSKIGKEHHGFSSQKYYKFVKYLGQGYVVLECSKGHRFEFQLRVTPPRFCPICEGIMVEDQKLRRL